MMEPYRAKLWPFMFIFFSHNLPFWTAAIVVDYHLSFSKPLFFAKFKYRQVVMQSAKRGTPSNFFRSKLLEKFFDAARHSNFFLFSANFLAPRHSAWWHTTKRRLITAFNITTSNKMIFSLTALISEMIFLQNQIARHYKNILGHYFNFY